MNWITYLKRFVGRKGGTVLAVGKSLVDALGHDGTSAKGTGLDAKLTIIDADVDPKVVGRRQILEVSVTSAANVGDVTLATVTDQPCVIESIIIHADTASQADLTSAAVTGGASKVITFIDAIDAAKADIDAVDKQVAWTGDSGAVRLAATKTIVMTLVGTGVTAVDLTITITFYACVNGGYLT